MKIKKMILGMILLILLVFSVSGAEQVKYAGVISVPETSINYIQFTPNASVYLTNISIYQGTIDDTCAGYYLRINDGSNNEIYRSNNLCYLGHYPGSANYYPNRQLTFGFDFVNVSQGVNYRVALYNGSSTLRGYSTSGANPLTPSGWNLKSNLNKDAYVYFFGSEPAQAEPVIFISSDMTNNSYINDPSLTIYYNGSVENTGDFHNCSLLENNITDQTDYVNITDLNYFVYDLTGSYNDTYIFSVECYYNETYTAETDDFYYFVDNVDPVINSDVLSNATFIEGSNYNIYANFSDLNLQYYNITLFLNDVEELNIFADDLNQFAENYTSLTLNDLGNYDLIIAGADSFGNSDQEFYSFEVIPYNAYQGVEEELNNLSTGINLIGLHILMIVSIAILIFTNTFITSMLNAVFGMVLTIQYANNDLLIFGYLCLIIVVLELIRLFSDFDILEK